MKSDEELSHIWLLKRWIAILRRARADYERLERQISEGVSESDDEGILPDPIKELFEILREAKAIHEQRLGRQASEPEPELNISEGDGEGILPDEPLRVCFEPVSPDMWDFLLQGLERAAKGEPDPFRLILKHRKPKFSRVERAGVVAEVIRLHHKGTPLEEARATVGAKKGVSDETIKKWFADDAILDEAASMVAVDRFPEAPRTDAQLRLYREERLNVIKRYRRHR